MYFHTNITLKIKTKISQLKRYYSCVKHILKREIKLWGRVLGNTNGLKTFSFLCHGFNHLTKVVEI